MGLIDFQNYKPGDGDDGGDGGDGFDDNKDDRGTPDDLFRALHARFQFTVDAAAAPHNAKLDRYWTIDDSGLDKDWTGERVWCNPPYSNVRPWIEKQLEQRADVSVILIPANRTDQKFWQDLVEPRRGRNGFWVEFLRGRPRFKFPPGDPRRDGPSPGSPFGCVLLIALGGRALYEHDRQCDLF